MVRKAYGLAALASLLTMATAASAETPLLMWQDVAKVQVQCLVPPVDAAARTFQTSLCERVRARVAQGAPVPVAVIAQGDPAVLAPRAVTLLVHASLQPAAKGRLVAFAIRPYRVSADQNSVLFGAAPRAATIPASAAGSPALDAALGASLSEIVPWLARPQGARPIPGRP